MLSSRIVKPFTTQSPTISKLEPAMAGTQKKPGTKAGQLV
jgi:hypothetical protein